MRKPRTRPPLHRPDCLACRFDARTPAGTRMRTRLLPPHSLPLSTVACTDCGQWLAQVIVDRGGTRHAGCGPTLEAAVWR